MYDKYNINYKAYTDKALIQKIGEYVKSTRLKANKTQAQLASDAGINRSTLIELENGNNVNLITFIQIMRCLEQLNFINFFEKEIEFSPMLLAEQEAKAYRKRASKSKPNTSKKSDW